MISLADVRREVNFCVKTKVPILGVVENMSGFVCPKCSQSSDVFSVVSAKKGRLTAGDKLSSEFGFPVLGRVPLDPRLMQSCEEGKPASEIARDSPAVVALASIAAKVGEMLKLPTTATPSTC